MTLGLSVSFTGEKKGCVSRSWCWQWYIIVWYSLRSFQEHRQNKQPPCASKIWLIRLHEKCLVSKLHKFSHMINTTIVKWWRTIFIKTCENCVEVFSYRIGGCSIDNKIVMRGRWKKSKNELDDIYRIDCLELWSKSRSWPCNIVSRRSLCIHLANLIICQKCGHWQAEYELIIWQCS